VHVRVVDLGVAEDLLDGLEGAAEEGKGGVEIHALEERVDLDERALRTFAISTETTEGTRVRIRGEIWIDLEVAKERARSCREKVLVQFLEAGRGEGSAEVDILEEVDHCPPWRGSRRGWNGLGKVKVSKMRRSTEGSRPR
jgi:hypothetical protein